MIESGTRPHAGHSRERARAIVQRVVAGQHVRASLVAEIASEVGADIICGILAPGDDLNSVDLARRFGTSRTPVREALLLLEHERLVDIPPWRRPVVAGADMARLREIYRVRSTLFAHLALDIAARSTEAEIASLRAPLTALEAACEAQSIDDYLWANVAFFERITVIAGNLTVKTILDGLLLRTLPFRRMTLTQPGLMAIGLEDHRALLRAWTARDGEQAAAVMRNHSRTTLGVLERALGLR